MRSQVVADEIWKETNAGKLAVFALDQGEAQHVITITATWAWKLDGPTGTGHPDPSQRYFGPIGSIPIVSGSVGYPARVCVARGAQGLLSY